MAIEFNCPHCQKFLKTGDEKAGLQAKCPGCGEMIVVPAVAAADAAATATGSFEGSAAAQPGWGNSAAEGYAAGPIVDIDVNMKTCPMCGERIKAAAIRCRYCGEDLGAFAGSRPVRELSVGGVVSRGWDIFKAQMGICMGGVLLMIGIQFAVNMMTQFMAQMLMFAFMAGGRNGMFAAFPIFFVLIVVQWCVQWYLSLGLCLLMLRIVRNQNPTIGDLFAGGPYFLRMIGNSFLFLVALIPGIAIAAGGIFGAGEVDSPAAQVALSIVAVAGFLIMFLISLRWWPYVYLLVDRNPAGLGALGQAWRLTSGRVWFMFLVLLLSALIYMGGLLAVCVGILFTGPLAVTIITVLYDDMAGQPSPEGSFASNQVE